jgi:adenine-specific DNA-methyltransferase
MKQEQLDLSIDISFPRFPTTRYQGSKLKIIDWIWENIKNLPYETVLDAFGGTGSVSYMLKGKFKQVTYNDILLFNYYIGKAIIENNTTRLEDIEVERILTKNPDVKYRTIIEDNFDEIYYVHKENKWLDIVAYNIYLMEDDYKKAIAYFSLFQSCIIKRPFNLFHRKNLYIRTSDVIRNFGNAATWEIPFDVCFKKFVAEANNAVFANGKHNIAINKNVFDIEGDYDLVYIDTPYISKKGSTVDYHDFYHFLEGLVDYPNWPKRIDLKSKHKRLKPIKSEWNNKNEISNAFERLFNKYQESIIVVSYRSDGIPSIYDLEQMLSKYKREVIEIVKVGYKYVLSHKECYEILLIGK